MKVLIACEYSGRVRDAFAAMGHDAWSCDLAANTGQHLQCDVETILERGWDLMVAHPPCTYICCSGNRWYADTLARHSALELVRALMDAPIEQIAIENPIGVISSQIRKPDQIIQPWEFGEGETKATCLWLKNLPPLFATMLVSEPKHSIHQMSPGPDRSKKRSLTYQGVADAMAYQWG